MIVDEPKEELNEEPGSFSPELLHGDEDEGAVDPEVDQAELVCFLHKNAHLFLVPFFFY